MSDSQCHWERLTDRRLAEPSQLLENVSFYLDIAGAQIQGQRELQEDAFLIRALPTPDEHTESAQLVIVADGIGGHGGGDVASQLAVRAFAECLAADEQPSTALSLFEDDADMVVGEGENPPPIEAHAATSGDFSQHIASDALDVDLFAESDTSATAAPAIAPSTQLRMAVMVANASLAEEKSQRPELQAMACTLVAVLVESNRLYWASVGDSHLYLIRDHALQKLNAVHNYGAVLDELVRRGETPPEVPNSERKMLTSAIEGGEIAAVDCPSQPLELKAGDTVLLASDGLDALSTAKVVFFANAEDSAAESVAALLQAVAAVGNQRQDNATVVVIKCRSTEAAPDVDLIGDELDLDFTQTM